MPVAVPPYRVRPADLAELDAPLLESGYAGVYPNFRRGGWCAKPLAGVYLGGGYRSPRDGAADVVRWWMAEYGPADWAQAFRHRAVPRLTVARARCEPGWLCWRAGAAPAAQAHGFRLSAWVDGRLRCVPPPHRRAVLFADAAAARAYFPQWCYDTFGLFATVHVRPWA